MPPLLMTTATQPSPAVVCSAHGWTLTPNVEKCIDLGCSAQAPAQQLPVGTSPGTPVAAKVIAACSSHPSRPHPSRGTPVDPLRDPSSHPSREPSRHPSGDPSRGPRTSRPSPAARLSVASGPGHAAMGAVKAEPSSQTGAQQGQAALLEARTPARPSQQQGGGPGGSGGGAASEDEATPAASQVMLVHHRRCLCVGAAAQNMSCCQSTELAARLGLDSITAHGCKFCSTATCLYLQRSRA